MSTSTATSPASDRIRPSWLSPLLAQGAVAAVFLVALVASIVESHLRDLVWGRLGGLVYEAVTQHSREEQQKATAATERAERIRTAMATIRTSLLAWSTRGGSGFRSFELPALMASIHTGVAEIRTEDPGAQAELDAITTACGFSSAPGPAQAQMLLAALEAKLRELQ